MTDQKTPACISDEMLDQLIGAANATESFQSGTIETLIYDDSEVTHRS